MTTIFKNAAMKKTLEAHYEQARATFPDAEDHWVPTRFGKTHVLVAGPIDAPPLLLIHGAKTSSAHMLTAVAPLAKRFRIYAVDIIGSSPMSIDARLPYEGSGIGEWLVDVLDAFGVAKAHVYGASLGGFVARKLAEHAPERIEKLILMVPAGFCTNGVWPTLSSFVLPMLAYRLFPNRSRLWAFMSRMMTERDDAMVDYFADAWQAFRPDLRMPPMASAEALAKFDRPTLVIGASEDIFFPGAGVIERAKALMPHAETELLEGMAHILPTDGASLERHCARVTEFLS